MLVIEYKNSFFLPEPLVVKELKNSSIFTANYDLQHLLNTDLGLFRIGNDNNKTDRYLMFYARSTAKGHIRAKQNVFLPQVHILIQRKGKQVLKHRCPIIFTTDLLSFTLVHATAPLNIIMMEIRCYGKINHRRSVYEPISIFHGSTYMDCFVQQGVYNVKVGVIRQS